MTPPTSLTSALADALRVSQDRCIRNYDMKVVKVCSRCAALAAYDAWVAGQTVPIVQTPALAREMVRKESDDE